MTKLLLQKPSNHFCNKTTIAINFETVKNIYDPFKPKWVYQQNTELNENDFFDPIKVENWYTLINANK